MFIGQGCETSETTSWLADITGAGTANTKGSWTQLIASTAHDTIAMCIQLGYRNQNKFLVDIGVGSGGNEQVIVPNLHAAVEGYGVYNVGKVVIPMFIPAGTRIASRCQCDATSNNNIGVGVQLFYGQVSSFPLGQTVITYGANTANTTGTQIDPGAVANTKGAWVEFSSACTSTILGMFATLGTRDNAALTWGQGCFEIGVGANGSEQAIVGSIHFCMDDQSDMIYPSMTPMYPIHVPAGTRLAVRAQSQITDATDRVFDIVLHCIT